MSVSTPVGKWIYPTVPVSSCEPFLRWLGGKRWLAPQLVDILGELTFRRYLEPFLGGGACFFHICPATALLSDVNEELVNVYVQVRDHCDELMDALRELNVDRQTFEHLRHAVPKCDLGRAVRFLYLNRTAFSGIYRLNSGGRFNVPFGDGKRTPEILWRNGLLPRASRALQGAEISSTDFEEVLNQANESDLVYCDPPYTVKHNCNGFRRYNERLFSWRDQERLAAAWFSAVERGATVIFSNAYHEEIASLYPGVEAHVFERSSNLCPETSRRAAVKEQLFVLRPG